MNIVMLVIIAVILIIYLITIMFYNKGVKKAFTPSSTEAINIKVSVVVAAKNEDRKIENLIDALDKQEYPKELFEVIIVDDNSRDTTLATVKKLISDKTNFTVLTNNNPDLPPKKGALSLGIEKSNFEFIMITDADCTPLPGWIKSFVNKFRDGHDFLIGVAPFNEQRNSDINAFICFENLKTTLLTFSAAGLEMPFSASARSFGFKKESFNKLGGYKNTLHTLGGDDDLLIQEAVKHNMSIGTVTNREGFVYSNTPFTFSEYAHQKKRHTKTSHHYLTKNKILVGYWHGINLLALLSILLMFFSIYFLALFFVKLISDYSSSKKYQSLLAYNFNPLEILFFQFLYELLIIFHFLNSFTRIKGWK